MSDCCVAVLPEHKDVTEDDVTSRSAPGQNVKTRSTSVTQIQL